VRPRTSALQILFAALASGVAAAQPPHWPTPEDIDRTLKASPFPDARRLNAQPTPQPPRVQTAPPGLDIEALARRAQQQPSPPLTQPSTAPLRIFITLDMPRASLQLLTDQASRAGAALVLRGLKGQSMRETLRIVTALIGDRAVAWVIDPQAFARYGIDKAPTFLLTLGTENTPDTQGGCTNACATPAHFVSVAGDVSLDYALEAMRHRRPDAAAKTDPLLKRLRTP
jgi:conjugal transfer pilus assembly protein TrbC